MKILEDKILERGKVIDNKILKVDDFFNYQIDIFVLQEVAKFIASRFDHIDKILTLEVSGIAFAVAVAYEFGNIPVVYGKKVESSTTINDDNYICTVHSFTHNVDNHIFLRKSFLKPSERILIVDDFLAYGNAAMGLIDICKQAGATVVGIAAGIEKEMQGGRKRIEALNIPVISAARIIGFKDNKPIFSKENY